MKPRKMAVISAALATKLGLGMGHTGHGHAQTKDLIGTL